jgi:hypothetical protein
VFFCVVCLTSPVVKFELAFAIQNESRRNNSEDDSRDNQEPTPGAGRFDVTPLTVKAASELFDATRFPVPGGSSPEEYSKPNSATFIVVNDFPAVVDQMTKSFDKLNWDVIARDDSTKDHAAFYLRHQQLFITCKIRLENKSLCRLNVEVLGNVDIRQVPKKDAQEVNFNHLDYTVYRTTAKLADIVDFYDQLLTKAGWQRYHQFDGSDYDSKTRRFAMYRSNGVALNVSADVRGGETFASLFCKMLEQDVPTPRGAAEIELDDHLFRQRFRSTQSVPELVKFFTSEMRQYGWTMPFGKQFEEKQAAMLFTRPVGDPVYLELLSRGNGNTIAYMAGPTRQVSRAVNGEFEIDYKGSLPLGETQMHTIAYQSIPFHEPLAEGSGRTIAESIFFNTKESLEKTFDFYRSYFSKLGWQAGQRQDNFIGDKLQSAAVTFKKSDAEIVLEARPWIEDTYRVNISGNGIEWPGDAFCQMMARDEAKDIEWTFVADEPNKDKMLSGRGEREKEGEPEESATENSGSRDTKQHIAMKDLRLPDSAKDVKRDAEIEMIAYNTDSVQADVKFFRDTMSKQGWKESDDSFVDEEIGTLTFVKEELKIQVSLAKDERKNPPVRVIIQGDGIRWTDE